MSGVALCAGLATAHMAHAQDTPPGTIITSAPTLNFYGLPGLVDMPTAETLPNGQVAVTVSYFGGQTRTSFSFQFSPRISGSFRYIGIRDWDSDGFETYRDRSFDIRYLLLKESETLPAITVGLQDFSGTGIYAAEYLVATKNFDRPFSLPGKVKVTAGLGWGRLGSFGSIGSPFGSDRPTFDAGDDTGGKPSTDQWFRGPVAPFGGIEWQVNDRLGFKAEYSSDAYDPETSRGVFDRKSSINVGAEYQVRNGLRLGAYYLYGSEIGVTAQIQLNPNRPLVPFTIAGPPPVIVRPSRSAMPERYDTSWAASERAPTVIRDAIAPELEEVDIQIEAITVSATRAELRVSSDVIANQAIVVGRVARSMARVLPASVETFDIVLMNNGLSMSSVTIERIEIETQEFAPNASGALLPLSVIGSAAPDPAASALVTPDLYPQFSWAIGPFLRPSFFDPDRPIRADVGIAAGAVYRFAPGWYIAGEARQRLAGNIKNGRESNSSLPRVRTDAVLYARGGDTTLENLYIGKQWKPGKDTFARVTLGYFEQMYGGISSELLWKPADSRLGLGVEANYVKKRDFDQRFGFQDYDVVTGHASAYYEMGSGYFAQVDAGRYLAGDYGATFSLTRQFANGWSIGGFFTLTDVSSEDFGEGSFDKGITFTVPVSWFTGRPSKQTFGQTIRPIQRDGGARVFVPGRLYDQVRSGQQNDLVADWGRVWE